MLPFLVNPRHFLSNPLIRLDLDRLNRGRSAWRKWGDRLIFLPFLLIASIPSQIYIDGNRQRTLALMTLAIHALGLVVGLRTLFLAVNLMGEDTRPEQWELLILTPLDARRLIIGKVVACFRAVWWSHALLAMTRLGLAAGYAQILHMYYWSFYPLNGLGVLWQERLGITPECPLGMIPYCNSFLPWPLHDYGSPSLPLDWWKILLAALMLIALHLMEALFLTVIGIWASLAVRGYLQKALSLLIRLGLGILAFGLFMSSEYSFTIAMQLEGDPYNYESFQTCGTQYSCPYYYNMGVLRFQRWVLPIESAAVTGGTLLDNGTLLGANIMRPIGSRLFVLRNLASGLAGIAIYIALIWFFLKLCVWTAIRRGASPPGYI